MSPRTSAKHVDDVTKTAGPLRAKGLRTQRRLMDAARVVFGRDGFIDARIADIAAEAGVSHGSFYTYFNSKTEILHALLNEVMTMVYDTRQQQDSDQRLTPRQRVKRGNRQWVKVVHEHGDMLRLVDEVATFDDTVAALRLRTRVESAARVQRSIERWQTAGLARDDLDATIVSQALVAMISNFTHFWLLGGMGEYDDETAIEALTELYCSALRLVDDGTVD